MLRDEPYLHAAMRVLALDRATAESVTRLRHADIRAILLKGPALSRWLYEDESERPYTDVDLMVRIDAFEDAERVLGEIGFRRMGLDVLPSDRPHYAITLRRDEDGLAIDLHTQLVGIGVAPPEAWTVLSEGTATIDIGGTVIEILGEPQRALVLALHAAKDGARAPRVLIDIERALRVVPEDIWRRAAATAETLDAVPGLVAGLRRVEGGVDLIHALGLPEDLSAEFVLRQDRPPPMAVGAKWFMEERGVRRRATVMAHKLFPPPEFMRAWRPIASRGRVGMALAYVWRPLWVTWHAMPAFRAARRASRVAKKARRA